MSERACSLHSCLFTNIWADILSIATLNCEGIRRSTDYIRNYLSINNCDILCLQETWHLDDNIQYFNKIHTDYLFTAISGVNSKDRILPGRPYCIRKELVTKFNRLYH